MNEKVTIDAEVYAKLLKRNDALKEEVEKLRRTVVHLYTIPPYSDQYHIGSLWQCLDMSYFEYRDWLDGGYRDV